MLFKRVAKLTKCYGNIFQTVTLQTSIHSEIVEVRFLMIPTKKITPQRRTLLPMHGC